MLPKFLTNLFKKKEEPAQLELEFLTETYFDANEGKYVLVRFVCECGLPAIKAKAQQSWYCIHCDEPCVVVNCGNCRILMTAE